MKRSEQQLIAGPVEGYKIVNADMTCRGVKFEVGVRKALDADDHEPLELCKHGLHFCTQPSGPWAYYNEGRVFKVRAYGVLQQYAAPGADYKMVCQAVELYEEILATGNWNTGNWNTGDQNTGNWNTGNWNTGNRNTGDGNCGSHHSGFFNVGEAPLFMFGIKTLVRRDELPTYLMNRLADLLMRDRPIDPKPFLAIPNATAARIKKLHEAHINARKTLKEA